MQVRLLLPALTRGCSSTAERRHGGPVMTVRFRPSPQRTGPCSSVDRASACEVEGRRFESSRGHEAFQQRCAEGDVAQLAEHPACNREGAGSIPAVSTSDAVVERNEACRRGRTGRQPLLSGRHCGFDFCRRHHALVAQSGQSRGLLILVAGVRISPGAPCRVTSVTVRLVSAPVGGRHPGSAPRSRACLAQLAERRRGGAEGAGSKPAAGSTPL